MTAEADLVRLGQAVDKAIEAGWFLGALQTKPPKVSRTRHRVALALLSAVGDERMVLINDDSTSFLTWRHLPEAPFETALANPWLRGEVIEVVVVRRTRIGEGEK